jgi:UDP-N-acetylmuramoyl-tripeptide--D-alanyl-D-alanine ligase
VTYSTLSERASCRAAGTGVPGGYRVFVRDSVYTVETPFRGEMGAENVAAVVAAASCLGVGTEDIRRGLAAAVLPERRFAPVRCGGFLVLDDSYNANPLSARRVLEAARDMAAGASLPLVLVMGGMEELGPGAGAAHERLGREMAGVAPALVFWKGGHAEAVRRGLAGGGYRGRFLAADTVEVFTAHLGDLGLREGLVLFKASRAHHLEALVEAFTGACGRD